jgi:hypothetical protein
VDSAADFPKKYMQLTEVETAFRTLKSELAIRPLFHQLEKRVKAHVLVAFLGKGKAVGRGDSIRHNSEGGIISRDWTGNCSFVLEDFQQKIISLDAENGFIKPLLIDHPDALKTVQFVRVGLQCYGTHVYRAVSRHQIAVVFPVGVAAVIGDMFLWPTVERVFRPKESDAKWPIIVLL